MRTHGLPSLPRTTPLGRGFFAISVCDSVEGAGERGEVVLWVGLEESSMVVEGKKR